MLLNYLKIAWRNIKRKPIFTVINITGLAIGLAACIMIGLWVQHELSYDRFHKNSDRIYRLASHGTYAGGSFNLVTASVPLAQAITNHFPSVQQVIRVSPASTKVIKAGDHFFDQKKYMTADPGFFKMFTFSPLQSSTEYLLRKPGSVVLTKTTAQKYFSSGQAVGKTLKVDGELKTVTGIVADPPPNSSLQFSVVETSRNSGENWPSLIKNWHRNPVYTYVILNSSANTHQLASSISQLVNKHLQKFGKKKNTTTIYLQPLTDIHLSRGIPFTTSGLNMMSIWIFVALALFILLLASINYINLATARSTERLREVGIRKTLGARRWEVARQFLGEALLTCLLSLLIALVLVQLLLPTLNQLFASHLSLSQLGAWTPVAVLIGLMILLIVGSSCYPALLLSGSSPGSIFQREQSDGSGRRIRKGLVIFQFTVAVFLIIATVVLYWQLNYMRTASLGFDVNQVITIHNIDKIRKETSNKGEKPSSLKQQYQLLKDKVKKLPDALNASVAYSLPSQGMMTTGFQGIGKRQHIHHQMGYTFVDENYLNTLGIPLVEGRDFSDRRHVSNAVIINKAAARIYFGKMSAINKRINMNGDTLNVVGVAQNFHFQSLRQHLDPMVFFNNNEFHHAQEMAVKLKAGHIQPALNQLRTTWKKLVPDVPFTYSFLDQQVAAQYKFEQQIGRIFVGFTILAIVVACLGLFGLTIYTTQRRTKEIGIRKVLGASELSIVKLLSLDFLKLVVIGIIIAIPLGWYAMHRLLQYYAYKINLSPWIFLLAGAVALLIALATVSWQSIRAALANPVDSLRSE